MFNIPQISIFQHISTSELASISSYIELVSFQIGDVVMRQGKLGKGLFIIKKGYANVTVRLPSDIHTNLAKLGTNDFFGEVSLIEGGIVTASVSAATKLECYFLSREIFEALRILFPGITHQITLTIAKQVCCRLRKINNEVAGNLDDIKDFDLKYKKKQTRSMNLTAHNLHSVGLSFVFLHNLTFFSIFTKKELKILFSQMKMLKVSKHTLFFDTQEKGNSQFIVVKGSVQVTNKRNNKVSKLDVLGPGDLFGHLSFIDGGSRSASCSVREDAVLLTIENSKLMQLQKNHPNLFYKWFNRACQNLVAILRAANKQLLRINSEK